MDSSSQEKEGNKKITEVKTFPVSFPLEQDQGNPTFNTNTLAQPSKEQIFKQAVQFHLQGNISKASKYYQYLINKGFKDYRVFTNFAGILQGIGKLQDAEFSYRKAIEIKPNYAEAHSNLGNILRDLGKLQEAELSTRKAIEIKPNYADAYNNLGIILIDLGNLKEARLCSKKLMSIRSWSILGSYSFNYGMT